VIIMIRYLKLPFRRSHAALLALTLLSSALLVNGEPLPWEKDYPSALARAKTEQHPLFLMLTETGCGPCKMLESQTLTAPAIRSGLKGFVWVKVCENKALDEKFHVGSFPTLVFLDSAGGRVLGQTSGYEPPEPFLRHILAARRAANLPMTKDMEELMAKAFVPNQDNIGTFINSGDADKLVKYLVPTRDDALRNCNYLVAKLHLPPGIKPADVLVMTYGEHPVPNSGVLLLQVPRQGKTAPLQVIAPDCLEINETIGVDDPAAISKREFFLQPLSAETAASLSGQVLRPDGQPASNAIVRICDWGATRADGQGHFRFARVSPGTFVVRGEAPGGEFQGELTLVGGRELKKDLPLKAVTTVGIRWALQKKGRLARIGRRRGADRRSLFQRQSQPFSFIARSANAQ